MVEVATNPCAFANQNEETAMLQGVLELQ